MTLAAVGDTLGSTGLTSTALIDKLKTATGIPVFMATQLDSAKPAELLGVKTNVYNTDQRIVMVRNGKFVDVAGNRWWNGFG